MIHAPELLRAGDIIRVNNVRQLPAKHSRRTGDIGQVQDTEPYRGGHIVLATFPIGEPRQELFYPEELDLLS